MSVDDYAKATKIRTMADACGRIIELDAECERLRAALKKLLPYAEQRRDGLTEFLGKYVDADIAAARAALEGGE